MKTALVTGGAIRIGAAIVRALSADCWRVIVHYNGSDTAAEALAAQLNECGGQVETIRCDLSDLEATERFDTRLRGARGNNRLSDKQCVTV